MVKYLKSNFFFKSIYYFFSFLLLIFFFLIQKIILIRVGYFYKDKIGHLIGNSQIYLYKKKQKKKYKFRKNSLIEIDLWVGENKSFYPVIENFYKKKFILFPQILLLGVHNLAFKYSFFKKFLISEHDWGMDFYNLTYKNKIENIINKKECEYAEKQLEKISIYPKDKIVCFINRNNFFNKKIINNTRLVKINEFRNSNFEDYLPAAKYLAKKGYKIIRMGSHDKRFKSKYVVNYTSSKINNLLIDIFLLKKADFIVTSGTGIDLIASHFFKKSICCVNLVPYMNIQNFRFSPKGVFLTKKLIKNKRFLSLKEIVKDDFFCQGNQYNYDRSGIKILDNSKKEILECVKEFYKIKNNNYIHKKKELLLHQKFYKILNKELKKSESYKDLLLSNKNLKLSLKQKPLANFSSYFLKNNPWFLNE